MSLRMYLRKLLGLEEINEKLDRIEFLLKESVGGKGEVNELDVLTFLEKPKTTVEVAKHFGKSRSYISYILNKLEKENKVKEVGKKRKEILYITR